MKIKQVEEKAPKQLAEIEEAVQLDDLDTYEYVKITEALQEQASDPEFDPSTETESNEQLSIPDAEQIQFREIVETLRGEGNEQDNHSIFGRMRELSELLPNKYQESLRQSVEKVYEHLEAFQIITSEVQQNEQEK